MSGTTKPVRIAVLGGGMSGLAAALALVRAKDAATRYEITVFQRGHRLGGKGASGRNPRMGQRIEEHGLHVLMGFYDNVFGVLKEAYEHGRSRGHLPPPAGPDWWSGVLSPTDDVYMAEPLAGGWHFWQLGFPRNALKPGVDVSGPEPGDAVTTVLEWLKSIVTDLEALLGLPALLRGQIDSVLDWIERDVLAAIRAGQRFGGGVFGDALVKILSLVWPLVAPLVDTHDSLRHAWMALYFGASNLAGALREGILVPGVDWTILDDEDWRAWMKRHAEIPGCAPIYSYESPPVNAVYDLIFSREIGFAAGSALRATYMMLVHYKGAVIYRMLGGMGDVVYAPLYHRLRDEGVKFELFHRVKDVRLDPADRGRVGKIVLERQVRLAGAAYDPIVQVTPPGGGPLPCWPVEPDWSQLDPGDVAAIRAAGYDMERDDPLSPCGTEVVLEVDRDFDLVVLAIPVGALAPITSELCQEQPSRFGAMVRGITTVRTQCMQLWSDHGLAPLGWSLGPEPTMGCYARPFDSWGDFSHVLPYEDWSGSASPPKLVGYFCDALYDRECTDAQAPATVKQHAIDWIEASLPRLWPAAVLANGQFDWKVLHDDAGGAGRARLDAQYVRANVVGTERYVNAAPGDTRLRLLADDSGFSNLFLGGDWVLTPMNAGCVEGACIGGLAGGAGAARAADALWAKRALPPYVRFDGDWIHRQPVRLVGATGHAFVLPADMGKLGEVCERLVDAPSGGAVTARPLFPAAILAFANIAQVRSADPGDSGKGYLVENDVAFWIPILLKRPAKTEIAWLIPYIFVDSPPAMIMGRELYGFTKELGTIATSPGASPPVFSADAWVFDSWSPGSRAAPRRVVDVIGASPVSAAPTWIDLVSGARALAADLAATLSSLASWPDVQALLAEANAFANLDFGRMPIVFLKQFRDAARPDGACYQALVRAEAMVERVGGIGRIGGAPTVALPRYDSLRIAETLGIAAPVEASVAFWATFDLTLGLGEEIWKS